MKILAHRGYWINTSEKNSKKAFTKAFNSGFGIELDIRMCEGKIYISHDNICGIVRQFYWLTDFLESDYYNRNLFLAINIKEDGMAETLKQILTNYKIMNYFCFDMSIPDLLIYSRLNLKYLQRISEYESNIEFPNSKGCWVDFFDGVYNHQLFEKLDSNKMISIVSPDLHKVKHLAFWRELRNSELISRDNVFLCTDLVIEAEKFFGGNINE